MDRALEGHGIIASGPFFLGSWVSTPDTSPQVFNPRQAIRLLNETGWTQQTGDHRMRRNGQPFKVSFLVDRGDKMKERVALFIRQQRQEVGIEIRLDRLDTPEFLEKVRTGDFDIALIQYNVGQDPITASLFFHSKYINTLNLARYRNTRVDSLFEAGELIPDLAKRQPLYHAIYKTLTEEQPLAFLFFKRRFAAANRRIEGIENRFGFLLSQHIHKWYVASRPVTP
ncbi:MAG: hypothetical protein FJY97_00690 [candidate division Zixibacteria bacterium]|nr:hypothetical protein [candidate division Zixibacteria bacterium]